MTKLDVFKGFSVTKSLKKVSLHGLGRQMPSLIVLESLASLEEISIEIKCFKVSNCLTFSIMLIVF